MTAFNTELLRTCTTQRQRIRSLLPQASLQCVNNFHIVDRALIYYLCASPTWATAHPEVVAVFNDGIEMLHQNMTSYLKHYDDAMVEGLPVFNWRPVPTTLDALPITDLLYPSPSTIRVIRAQELEAVQCALETMALETSPSPNTLRTGNEAVTTLIEAQELSRQTLLYAPFFASFDALLCATIKLCVTRNAFHLSHTAVETIRLNKIITAIKSTWRVTEN